LTDSSNSREIFASFDGSGEVSLPELSLSLLEEQKTSWKDLREGYEGLLSLKERQCEEGDFSVILQYNPQRIKSSGADTDPAAIKLRPCFLCGQNRPPEQEAILYRRKFLVLCNPAPIFHHHFTIAHIEHRPQLLKESLPFFLQLAKDFHPFFALLYNGSRCGASAPDHLHFQAFPRASVPILSKGDRQRKMSLKETNGVTIFKTVGEVVSSLIVESRDNEALIDMVTSILGSMQRILSTNEEPMINLMCLYHKGKWRIIFFPRTKHRPDVYFRLGSDRILISPGAVDMGGLLIITREEDFSRLNATSVRNILLEVSLSDDKVEEIVKML
jgi:hypothetical protein